MNYSLLRAAGSLKHKRISLPAPVSFCIFLSSFLLSVSIHMSQSALKCVLKKKKKNQLLISPSLLYKITYFLIDLISCFHILKRESLGSIFKSLILMNSVPALHKIASLVPTTARGRCLKQMGTLTPLAQKTSGKMNSHPRPRGPKGLPRVS